MSILDHKWGVSDAADRVWALVSGFPPSKSSRRTIVVLQACIDDSIDPDGYYVFAGYVSSAEEWAKFAQDWEALLVFAPVDRKTSQPHFKMAQMWREGDRTKLPLFLNVIERYVHLGVSLMFKQADLREAMERVFIPGVPIDWAEARHPINFAYRGLMDMFHSHRDKFEELVPMSEKVDFIFDESNQKAILDERWAEYLESRPLRIKPFFGKKPLFRDDKEFLPLQSADYLAWWVRRGYREWGPLSEKMFPSDYQDVMKPSKKIGVIRLEFNADQIVEALRGLVSAQVGVGWSISYGSGIPWPSEG